MGPAAENISKRAAHHDDYDDQGTAQTLPEKRSEGVVVDGFERTAVTDTVPPTHAIVDLDSTRLLGPGLVQTGPGTSGKAGPSRAEDGPVSVEDAHRRGRGLPAV